MAIDRALMQKAHFLYKIEFDKAARAHGGTVRWQSQHAVLWGAIAKEKISETYWLGLCAGLAIRWIQKRKQGIELLDEFNTATIADAQKLGTLISSVFSAHQEQNTLTNELGRTASADQTFAYPYTNVGSALRSSRYYYLSSGSHAMALATDGGGFLGSWTVSFYDPNVGLVSGIAKSRANGFFRDYLSRVVDHGLELVYPTSSAEQATHRSQKQLTLKTYR